MSHSASNAELTARVAALESDVAELIATVSSLRLDTPGADPEDGGFQVVSGPGAASSRGGGGGAGYNELALQIPEVPDFALGACARLSGSSLSSEQRARRAWESGWWARFVLRGDLSKPRPSAPIDLPNTVYIVLRAPTISSPVQVRRASDYRALVGNFTSPSVSHGFPSQAEAKVYCWGADVEFPSEVYQWSPAQ
eukprot:Skav208202  [mRNA]  locus=scaffold2026:165489:166076:+ [translate_table: standard]